MVQPLDGQRHFLCACYHSAVLSALEAALHADRLVLHQFLERVDPTIYVELPAVIIEF